MKNTQIVPILKDLIAKKESLDSHIYAFYFEGVKQGIRLLDDKYELYAQLIEFTEKEGLLPELI